MPDPAGGFAQDLLAAVQTWTEGVNGAITRAMQVQISDTVQRVAELTSSSLRSLHETLSQIAEAMTPMTHDLFSTLAASGWYPDMDMPFAYLDHLVNEFKRDPGRAKLLAMNYYRKQVDSIGAALAGAWPHRSCALEDAFSAHRSQLYYASIPVFLAQAEGIVWERLGVLLYSSKGSRQRILDNVLPGGDPDGLTAAILHPILTATPLNRSQKERSRGSYDLNRHEVLHGHDTTYGTEESSLRTLSHLTFISQVMKHLTEDGVPAQ